MRRRRYRPTVNKTNLDAAFVELRGTGLIARQAFLCCGSCAGYQIALDAKKLDDAGKPPTGCVFYHKQDAANLRNGDDFYLSFGRVTHYGDDKQEKHYGDTQAVGKLVTDVLHRYGVQVEWDGNPDARIKVKFASLGELPETT